MDGHISTAEAKARGLPGSDVYLFSHLIYHDELNRASGVVHLCREALKAFKDSITLGERYAIEAELLEEQRWLARGGFAKEEIPECPHKNKMMNSINLENFKIAAGFELVTKSILIEQNIIVQEIDSKNALLNELSKSQKDKPVLIDELLKIEEYRFNGQLNYIPGLRKKSLNFDTIINKPHYRAVLKIPENELNLINEFRKLRNQIHFPTDVMETPLQAAYPKPIVEFFQDFINTWIIERANLLTQKYGLYYNLEPPL